jgi:hypothetical protein
MSSGGHRVFSAPTFDPLHRLQGTIAEFIEHPPQEPRTVHIENVDTLDLRGAQGSQFGNNNSQINNWTR